MKRHGTISRVSIAMIRKKCNLVSYIFQPSVGLAKAMATQNLAKSTSALRPIFLCTNDHSEMANMGASLIANLKL